MTTESNQTLEEAMKPGSITRDGFRGSDSRPIADILRDDDATVRAMGVTHPAIAGRMTFLMQAGSRGLGDFIAVPPHFEVRVDTVRGQLPCPFGEPTLFPKTNVTVRNTKTKTELTYTELHIHLIGQHGFYEGRGNPFRLDPDTLVAVLEVGS